MERLPLFEHPDVLGDAGCTGFGSLEVADAERHREAVLRGLGCERGGDLRVGIQRRLQLLFQNYDLH